MSHAPSIDDFAHLPTVEFAFPGPLRDQLVSAILDGRKVSTTGLAWAYEVEGERLPMAGDRFLVVDSCGRAVAVIEDTEVSVVPLGDVDLAHAEGEGEGHLTVAEWRAAHEAFWRSDPMLAKVDDSAFTVDDSTLVVLERFRLVARLDWELQLDDETATPPGARCPPPPEGNRRYSPDGQWEGRFASVGKP